MNTSPAIAAATAAGAGALGWIAFRMYVRSEVVRTLNEQYGYDQIVRSLNALRRAGIDLKVPTAEELAEGVTPIWSTVMPKDAINDILQNGRQSEFWPEAYRGSGSEKLEPYLLAGLRKAQQQGKPLTPQETTNAILSGITESIVRSAYHEK